MKSVGDFPVGHAGTFIEIDDGGLGIGAELALSGTGGVGRLQLMPATQMLAAFAAMAAVDVEFADDGLPRNVGLKLLVEMIFDNGTAAFGTLIGQGRIEGFIDSFGRRRLAMSVIAVQIALLATRFFGPFLGFALGERRGLSFGGSFEFFDAFLELRNEVAKLLIFREQLLVRRSVHASLGSDEPCQLHEIMAIFLLSGKGSLNNHP